MIPVSYNIRSLAVRKATTLATAIGIALVVFVLASSLMLAEGIKKTLGSSGRVDNAIVLRAGSDAELSSTIEDALVPVILAAPGVKTEENGKPLGAAELVVVGAMEKLGANGVSNVQIRGVTDDVMRLRPEAHIVAGRPARAGADEVILGARIRGRFKGLDLGQTFDLKKNRPATVVGIFEAGGSSYESEVWVDRDLLRQSYNRLGIYSSVRVTLESPTKFDVFKETVEHDKRLGLQALRETTFYEKQSEKAAEFITILGTIVSIFFAGGAMIGATITMYAAVANRQREIGTLRALGFSRTSVLASFVLEAVVLAFVGGVFGAAGSCAMGLVHFSMLNSVSWSEVVFSFDPTPRILAIAVAFSCGMGLVGGLLPAIRAARTSPLKAIRG